MEELGPLLEYPGLTELHGIAKSPFSWLWPCGSNLRELAMTFLYRAVNRDLEDFLEDATRRSMIISERINFLHL